MKFGSLFAGIGGIDLGLERAGMECAWQVEIDPFCRKVLAKHWPDVPKFEDVREVGAHNLPPVDVIAGGFPCQDISLAGKGAGIAEGTRSGLWFEYRRIICELRPRYVFIENVPALLARGGARVASDIAEVGMDYEWDCIPAGALGAHFVGDRFYGVASDPEAGGLRREGGWPSPMGQNTWRRDEFERLVRLEVQHGVPAGSLGRISDGLPNRMDRLRGLGNAVVPQVAEFVGRLVVEHELLGGDHGNP